MNPKDLKEMRKHIIKIADEPYELRKQLYDCLVVLGEQLYGALGSCLLNKFDSNGFTSYSYSGIVGIWAGTMVAPTTTIQEFLLRHYPDSLSALYTIVPPRISFR